MRKFKTSKRFSLSFLGTDWKTAYIDFERVTISDVQNIFPKFSAADSKNEKQVIKGISEITSFLESKFIGGKGVLDDGSIVDLKPEDIKALPSEVLSNALDFLSQDVAPKSSKQ